MIVTSIHDPAIFAPARFDENDQYAGRIAERLNVIRHRHLLVVDDTGGKSIIAKAIANNLLQSSDPRTQMIANAVVTPKRCLRLPVDPNRRSRIAQWIEEPGSAESVALAGHGGVDVCVVDRETMEAIEAEEISLDRITTLAQYHTTDAARLETIGQGGAAVGTLTVQQFLAQIVQPVMYWAKKLTIIDKMISRAAFGDSSDPTGTPSSNWPKFDQTLKAVFDEWDKGPFAQDDRLTVITDSASHIRRDGDCILGNDLAAELAQRLSIPTHRVRVILKRPENVRAINHDRYLVTNHGFCIGITGGFDLIDRTNQKCGVSDVFLRQPQQQDDIIVRLINSARDTAGIFPAA